MPGGLYETIGAQPMAVPDYSTMLLPSYSTPSNGLPSFYEGIGTPGIGSAGTGSGGIGALGIANAGISGLQTLGNLWMGMKAMKLAKKQYKFQKKMTETNLANQMKSYNTALADRARSRGVMEGQTEAEMNAYVNNNSLNAKGYKQGTGYTGNNMGTGSLIPGSYASLIPGGITAAPAAPAVASTPAPSPSGSGGSTANRLSGFSALASRAAQERGSRDEDRTVN